MQKTLLLSLFAFVLSLPLYSQMWNGQDTLYGNEWINYDQSYFKIKVAQDGIYRLPYETLINAGIPANELQGSQYQVFYMGQEIPLYTSSAGPLTTGDYLEFYGQKNRSQLDRYLFQNPDEEMLNPEYSLFTDTSAYFLTWVPTGSPTTRYTEVVNDLTDLPEREEWYWTEEKVVYSNQLHKKYQNTSGVAIYYSHFDGDGFASGLSTSFNVDVPTPNVYDAGPPASVSLSMISNDNVDGHHLLVSVEGQQLVDESFTGTQLRKYTFELPASELDANLNWQITGTSGNADRYAIGNAMVRYPRTFSLNNANYQYLELPEANGARYLEITGINGTPPILYDLDQRLRLEGIAENGVLKYKLPAAAGSRHLVLIKESGIVNVSDVEAQSFLNYADQDAEFIILSNNQLFSDENGDNWVQAYADYRSSAEGGNYSTAVIDVETLYDQFSYGLNRHPIAVRNFAHFIKKYWSDPQYFFIIGKGREYRDLRTASQLNAASSGDGVLLVPTFGYPGSDNLMLSDPWGRVPIFPLGRLSAITTNEVKNYLDKVLDFESNRDLPQTIDDRAWMKRAIHLGGGGNPGEQGSIKSSLEAMRESLEEGVYGGKVTSYFKTSTSPIQTTELEAIFSRINEGVSLLTFFGHSSPGTFDFDIDNPENYSNAGKYPLILSLGCYSGNFFTSGRGIGERFIRYQNKGAIAFGASRGIGFISALSSFARKYYDLLAEDLYGESIGKILLGTLENYGDNTSISMGTLVEQFNLQGDPAIRLNPQPGPDYVVDTRSVEFSPRLVSTQLDSFNLNFEVLNLGLNYADTIDVKVTQQLPNNEKIDFDLVRIPAPGNQQSITLSIPTLGKTSVGLNTFFITVDASQDVSELPSPEAEMNNDLKRTDGQLGIPLFIVDNTARPVFPAEYALVGEAEVTLKANTSDPLAPERKYVMEIDTSALFNSPMKLSTEIIQRGGLVKWTPTPNYQDSVVYYWRISPDSVEAEVGYIWSESSFTYIRDIPNGWGQNHYWQFLDNDLDSLQIDSNRVFNFPTAFVNFRIKNKIRQPNDGPAGFMRNNNWIDFFTFNLPQSISIAVFHPSGANNLYGATYGHLWFNFNPGEYGSTNTVYTRIACFPFKTETTEQRHNIINFLNDVVPDDALVVAYTALSSPSNTLDINEWAADSLLLNGQNLFNVFESYGANLLRSMESGGVVPYLIAFRKGGEKIYEHKAVDENEAFTFDYNVPVFGSNGNLKSVKVGPASQWDKLDWQFSQQEVQDSVSMSVYGYKPDGLVDSLFTEYQGNELNLSSIDASQYPYIGLKYFAEDLENQSPPALKRWNVFFEGLPEVSVAPNLTYDFHRDTIQQGEPISVNYGVENIGEYSIDSLVVKYTITNSSNESFIQFDKIPSTLSGEEIITSKTFDSSSLLGEHQLSVEVNPEDNPSEQFHFNNFINQSFHVERDRRSPILDVTFDGVRILNEDIVSSRPEILVSLKDENSFLFLSDTASFELQLEYPDGSINRVHFTDDRVRFMPGTEQNNNRATIALSPVFSQDGLYWLRIKAKDVSDNPSGIHDFEVSFKVVNKSMISNVLNYPNPFSTSTQFVYTLTGDTPPQSFMLRIMTVSGRIVRELSEVELGALKIGTHRTEYAWDGTDEYGDKLANGVYLYRFIIKEDGTEFEKYENGTDKFFKAGIGKMVILR